MVGVAAAVESRARQAVAVLSPVVRVAAVYLFGSHVGGLPDRWSDIDLAVFVEGLEEWDLHARARASARVQAQAGDEIEIHFLSADSLEKPDPVGFAAWVIANGKRLS